MIGTDATEAGSGFPRLPAKHATPDKPAAKPRVLPAYATDAIPFAHVLQFALQPAPHEPMRESAAASWNAAVRPRDLAPAGFAPADLVPTQLAPSGLVPASLALANLAPAQVAPSNFVPADILPRHRSPAGPRNPFGGDPVVIAGALIRSMFQAGRAGVARGAEKQVPGSALATEDFETATNGAGGAATEKKLAERPEPGPVPNWTGLAILKPTVVKVAVSPSSPLGGDPAVIAGALIRPMFQAGRAGGARGVEKRVPANAPATEDFETATESAGGASAEKKLAERAEPGSDQPLQNPGPAPSWTDLAMPKPPVVEVAVESHRDTQPVQGMEMAMSPTPRAAAGVALAFAARISAKDADAVPDAAAKPARSDIAGAPREEMMPAEPINTLSTASNSGRRHQAPENASEVGAEASTESTPAPQGSIPWIGTEAESKVPGPHASPRTTQDSGEPPRTEEPFSAASAEAPRKGTIQNGLTLRVTAPDSSLVDVRVRQRMGELQVAVRTPDPALQDSLRRELPELAQALDRAGFDAALITPAARAAGMENESQSGAGQRDSRGAGHGHGQAQRHGQDHFQGGSGQRERERLFETWLEQMED